jgi:hypothetical protein
MMADFLWLTVSLSEFIPRSKIAFLADQAFAVDIRSLVETVDNVYLCHYYLLCVPGGFLEAQKAWYASVQ